jgi:hypothetical protein
VDKFSGKETSRTETEAEMGQRRAAASAGLPSQSGSGQKLVDMIEDKRILYNAVRIRVFCYMSAGIEFAVAGLFHPPQIGFSGSFRAGSWPALAFPALAVASTAARRVFRFLGAVRRRCRRALSLTNRNTCLFPFIWQTSVW